MFSLFQPHLFRSRHPARRFDLHPEPTGRNVGKKERTIPAELVEEQPEAETAG